MAKNRCLALYLAWALLVVACRAAAPAAPATPPLQYIEHVTQHADANAALPLLIVMHGLGDSPEGILPLFAELSPATRIIAPRAPDPWGEGSSWYPLEESSPARIAERAALVAKLIAHVRAERPTRGKAVVTGFSQGGVLSFALAARHSGAIAGAVPIAGALPHEFAIERPSGPLTVHAFHGKEDRRIAYADAERTVTSLQQAGFDASLSGYAGVGHGVSDEMARDIHASLARLLGAARLPGAQPPASK
jgi:phospholipase/carboxylesterase